MTLKILKIVLIAPLILFIVLYLLGAYMVMTDGRSVEPLKASPTNPIDIAIFGASGTAGDGILKAALASSDVGIIQVVTRRVTPRMEEGVKTGKIRLTIHKDYLDYTAVIKQFSHIDTVYWAIGISALGMDEATYGMIHVDFPMQFVSAWDEAWNEANESKKRSFHFISSSDIEENSSTMWVQQKIRAEKQLFSFAEKTNMRVIAYRPDYIGATEEEASLGQTMLYGFFAPVGAAIKAKEIGQVMLEVTARGDEFNNGATLSTAKMRRYSDAYEARQRQR
ncbi:MAG: hypothetical protein ACJAWF_004023 [Candidatus Azotimanducaceae bacterium]|jgi:hypothetical protein